MILVELLLSSRNLSVVGFLPHVGDIEGLRDSVSIGSFQQLLLASIFHSVRQIKVLSCFPQLFPAQTAPVLFEALIPQLFLLFDQLEVPVEGPASAAEVKFERVPVAVLIALLLHAVESALDALKWQVCLDALYPAKFI